ncbi:MAG: patatin-like phospholipase family protein [Flavobacteriales bacterium]|nr:patatin-like phospholipase family protein [Flavobacteriales bacterium]
MDLLIAGTNVSKQRSGFFSVGYTPDFPVIDAVTISMSIPFVFKPVIVDRPVRFGGPDDEAYNESYRGMWVDGGMLNNFPLHAYDSQARLPDLTYQGKRRAKWGGYEVAVPPSDEQRPFQDWSTGCAPWPEGQRAFQGERPLRGEECRGDVRLRRAVAHHLPGGF